VSIHVALNHVTSYRYDRRVGLSPQVIRLRPAPHCRTPILSYSLRVEPAAHFINWQQDPFSNYLARVVFPEKAEQLAVTVDLVAEMAVYNPFDFFLEPAAEVFPFAYEPALRRDLQPYLARGEPTPRLRELLASIDVREQRSVDFLVRLNQRLQQAAAEFALPSPFVPRLAELRDYALRSYTPGRPGVEAAVDLMARIHADFGYEPNSTEVSTPLSAVVAQRRGVCQDFAHVAIGCLRALGLPAAYVSGYLLTEPPPGRPRLLGTDATHAWFRIWCPQSGWIDLDPTNAVAAGPSHVVIAWGRDYGDVVPLRGVIRGGGDHGMSVRVSVTPLGSP
jgi:transglutaminase-like putative cysteine protease